MQEVKLVAEAYHTEDRPSQENQNGRWEQRLSIQQHLSLVISLRYHFPPNNRGFFAIFIVQVNINVVL